MSVLIAGAPVLGAFLSSWRKDGIDALAIQHAHALHVATTLPAHHSDPFDRLLIANVELLWAGQGKAPRSSPKRPRAAR